jgi:uncharacterized membrane protein YvlD (DUF360 family)
MPQLIASVLGFALGLLLLPALIPGMRMKGTAAALKVGLVCGVLSVFLGKLLMVILTLLFLPIALLGPIGVFIVQGFVNAILLAVGTRLVDGIEFDRRRSALWAAFALTVFQVIVRQLV